MISQLSRMTHANMRIQMLPLRRRQVPNQIHTQKNQYTSNTTRPTRRTLQTRTLSTGQTKMGLKRMPANAYIDPRRCQPSQIAIITRKRHKAPLPNSTSHPRYPEIFSNSRRITSNIRRLNNPLNNVLNHNSVHTSLRQSLTLDYRRRLTSVATSNHSLQSPITRISNRSPTRGQP